MSLFRRNARRDANEQAIFEVLRQAGCSILRISSTDAPDAVIGLGGRHNVLIEVKTETGTLKPGQAAWHRTWRGRPVVTLRSVDEALRLVGTLRMS
jgi:Holliday junction resolvase